MGESPATVSAPPLNCAGVGATMTPDKTRVLLLAGRKALILLLDAVEDWLEMPHSVMGTDERRMFQRWQNRQMGG